MLPLVLTLIGALFSSETAGADTALSPPPADTSSAVSLDVPYVPQTEFLCGGAAVAMVFRYWGAAHTGIDEFAPLVDRRAHGIETNALVRAVSDRRWRTLEGPRSIDTLESELRAGHPIIALIEDRPQRYHYVVVVGIDAGHVVVHDPTWGPSRRLPFAAMARRWAPAEFWSLVILPEDRNAGPRVRSVPSEPNEEVRLKADTTSGGDATNDRCSTIVANAIDRVRQEGFARADVTFEHVRAECPSSAAVPRELAGIRFSERRWRDASAIAEEALALDPNDAYTWDLLGSSRFMQDDIRGALRAWNKIGKPRIDVVRLDGLTRTKYALVADALRLPTGALLTPERFDRAERRLKELPDAASSRLAYRPQPDGFAAVEGAIVEAPTVPNSAAEWAARGIRSAVDREIVVSIPGATGQGEVWSAGWRWWNNRPRVSGSFAAPHLGILPGVWRVDASWQRETFRASTDAPMTDEERIHGGLAINDWMTARVRYELATSIDAWTDARYASLGGSLERRAFDDRMSIAGGATTWIPLTHASRFDAAHVATTFRSAPTPLGTVWRAAAGLDAVSAGAPMGIWQGAGEGQARPALARAHPLLDEGVVSGPVFGRHLMYATTEVQRWLGASPLRFAVAAFVDVAHASHRAPGAGGEPSQIDTGIGVRVKSPSQRGTLRVDFGTGLRDGARAVTFGWQY